MKKTTTLILIFSTILSTFQLIAQQLPFDDAKAIAKSSGKALRIADTLFIHLKNGTIKHLVCAKSESDGQGNKYYGEIFLLKGYLPKEGYFLIQQSWQDGDHVYLMIRETDGHTYSVIGLPIISPNRRLFAMVSMDLFPQINANAISVCSFAGDSISLQYELAPTSWGPKDATWLGNDTLSIVKSVPTDSSFRSYIDSRILLINRSGKWTLSGQ